MIEMDTDKNGFEIIGCSRCGGSGHYSFNLMYGTVCFKCHGKGHVYTKRGLAARSHYINLLSKKASELVPGDIVFYDSSGKWVTVLSITVKENGRIEIRSSVVTWVDVSPDMLFRYSHAPEQSKPKLDAALRYQTTLSKTGKPLKRAKKDAQNVPDPH